MPSRHSTAIACTAMALAGLILAPAAQSATLADVVQQTLQTNPTISDLIYERAVREELAEEARAGNRPKVDFIGEAGWEATRSPATRARRRAAGLDPKEHVDLPRRQALIDGRWVFFDGDRTKAEVARRLDGVDSGAYLLQAEAERITNEVAQNYINVLRDRELVELSQQNLLDHQRIHDQIRERSDSGVGRQADFDQVDGRLALAESNLISSEAKLEDTRAAYARVVGAFPPEQMEPPAVSRQSLPSSVIEATDIAENEHPLVLASEADLAATAEGIRVAKSAFHPTVEANLQARYGDDLDGVEGYDQDFIARVNVGYNLYNGLADQARVRRGEAVQKQAQDARETALRRVAEEVRLAWNALNSAERRLTTLERQVQSSQGARDAYRQQFNLGQRTLLDVLDSENEQFEARRELARARADYNSAIYGVLAGMGRLVSELQQQLPEQAIPLEARVRTNPERAYSTVTK